MKRNEFNRNKQANQINPSQNNERSNLEEFGNEQNFEQVEQQRQKQKREQEQRNTQFAKRNNNRF